jgi:hypothetical protein
MEPGRKIISFYTARLIGGSRVWYFVGSKAAFPTYYGMASMWYSNYVRDLWPAQQFEPILRFYRAEFSRTREAAIEPANPQRPATE